MRIHSPSRGSPPMLAELLKNGTPATIATYGRNPAATGFSIVIASPLDRRRAAPPSSRLQPAGAPYQSVGSNIPEFKGRSCPARRIRPRHGAASPRAPVAAPPGLPGAPAAGSAPAPAAVPAAPAGLADAAAASRTAASCREGRPALAGCP